MKLNARSKIVPAVLLGLFCGLLAPTVGPAATQTASAVAIQVNRHGLPVGYSIPAGTSAAARAVVTFALAQRGKPYVFGAIGPRAYDCSGLMMTAWLKAGRHITRTTLTQRFAGTAAHAASLRPGDLVLTPGGGSLARPDHVGMYIGHGLVIHAPHTGAVVTVLTYRSFVAGGVSALRHIA